MVNPNNNTKRAVKKVAKTLHFRVEVPENAKAGNLLRIRIPDGTEGDVRVPPKTKPGESFIFEMKGKGDRSGEAQIWDDSIAPHHNKGKITVIHMIQKIYKTFVGALLHFLSLNDKFFWQDLMAALVVGIVMGLSIVAGFLSGIILVTRPS